jgi:putative ABC transport system ATP-binding protein
VLRRFLGGAVDRAPDETAPSRHLIDLRAVVKDYLTDAGSFRALRGVDLQVDAGEFIAVVGKSGSGKSTLMNMMTGIDRATAGDVWVGGTHLNHLSEGRTAEWRGRSVGVIFQFFQLLPTLTVVENVMLPMDFAGLWTPREREERAMALLDQVEMVDQARKLPSATSGGQQQRVAIARALANDPPILVADEPTGNLDSATAEAVIRLFDELVAAGKTIVMVTHDREIAAHARRTVHMVDGDLVDGTLPDDGETPRGTGEPLPALGRTPNQTAAVTPARA